MKRKMIVIDENKCTGCGLCVQGCPEGALQIIDGKARLVSEMYCDGLGACVGECPEGALRVEERKAEPYDEIRVLKNILKKGPNVLKEHLKHLYEHGETEYLNQALSFLKSADINIPDFKPRQSAPGEAGAGGCPGSRLHSFSEKRGNTKNVNTVSSKLSHWPVQLRLIPPHAPFLKNADLLITADCVPVTYASFHQDYLEGKVCIIFCPKLDHEPEEYVEKLSAIFQDQNIQSITVIRMEVPCCSGVRAIVQHALEKSGANIPVKEDVITLQGEIKDT